MKVQTLAALEEFVTATQQLAYAVSSFAGIESTESLQNRAQELKLEIQKEITHLNSTDYQDD